MGGRRTYTVRQVFYAGIGGGGAVFCMTNAFAFRNSLSSLVLIMFALVCTFYAVRNAGLSYIVDDEGIMRSSTWGARLLAHWSDVVRSKYFEQDMTFILLLRDGSRVAIRCGELAEPQPFIRDVRRHAPGSGGGE